MKPTTRLLSGSDSHWSKSFSIKFRLDLRDRADNSGSCNSSTSNDATSLTTSMFIQTNSNLSFTNQINRSRRNHWLFSRVEQVKFQCLWIETSNINQILKWKGRNALKIVRLGAADLSGTLDLSGIELINKLYSTNGTVRVIWEKCIESERGWEKK